MNQSNFWQRLKHGLKKTSDQIGQQLKTLVKRQRLDEALLDDLEDLLIQSDMGVTTAQKLRQALYQKSFNQEVDDREIRQTLANEIEKILTPVIKPLDIKKSGQTHVVLIVGVNGSGKTTTISKLTHQWLQQGLTVELAACDTFRAAAVEQLQVWGQRLNVPVHTTKAGGDAAGLAFDAVTQAKAHGADIICIDTAGRLHNKQGLMDELTKLIRVIQKVDNTAPHYTLLILDATTGQNAHNQVGVFQEMCGVTGLIMTKLDGTAKGGVIVGLAERFAIPIYAMGVGEKAEDLQPFSAKLFAHSLMGLDHADDETRDSE